MSAYLISDASIDVIVHAAIQYGVITPASADVIGQAIKRQNEYALYCRYGDDRPPVTTYTFTPFTGKVIRMAIDGCIRCWNYQCSEFTGSDETAISVLVQHVEQRNLDRIPNYNPDTTPRYWGVSTAAEAMVPAPEVQA